MNQEAKPIAQWTDTELADVLLERYVYGDQPHGDGDDMVAEMVRRWIVSLPVPDLHEPPAVSANLHRLRFVSSKELLDVLCGRTAFGSGPGPQGGPDASAFLRRVALELPEVRRALGAQEDEWTWDALKRVAKTQHALNDAHEALAQASRVLETASGLLGDAQRTGALTLGTDVSDLAARCAEIADAIEHVRRTEDRS